MLRLSLMFLFVTNVAWAEVVNEIRYVGEDPVDKSRCHLAFQLDENDQIIGFSSSDGTVFTTLFNLTTEQCSGIICKEDEDYDGGNYDGDPFSDPDNFAAFSFKKSTNADWTEVKLKGKYVDEHLTVHAKLKLKDGVFTYKERNKGKIFGIKILLATREVRCEKMKQTNL